MKREEAISHYASLYPEFIEDFEYFNDEYLRGGADRLDSTRSKLSRYARWVGIMSYLVDRDVKRFREFVGRSAQLRLEQYECFERGESVDPSYVALLGGYTALFHAMAASNFELAAELADVIGGRDTIEQDHDHPSDIALGYLLKSFIDSDDNEMKSAALENFRKLASDEYSSLPDFFDCLIARDTVGLNKAFERFLVDYVRSAESGGVFADDLGDAISLIGIALANYAEYCDLAVSISNPYVPSDLIASQ